MDIKQSSAVKALVFFMYDSSDHVTGKTGLSPMVVLSKNGATFASPTGSVSEIGNGFYKVAANATDSNTLGQLALSATASGADQATGGWNIVAFDPDTVAVGAMVAYTQPTGFLAAVFPGTVASTTNITAGTITTVTNLTNAATVGDFTATMKTSLNAATPSVTISDKTGFSLAAGSIASATFAAGATIPRVTLADTITTYTGNTVQTGDSYAVVNSATFGNAKLVRSTTPANTLDVASTGEAGLDFSNIKQATVSTTLNNISVPNVGALTSFAEPLNTEFNTLADQVDGFATSGIALTVAYDAAKTAASATALAAVQTHGDSAWATATGFSTLTAAGVRTAIGIASANLDTQLLALVKIQAASYDSASVSGTVITLSNGKTQTVTDSGRVTSA